MDVSASSRLGLFFRGPGLAQQSIDGAARELWLPHIGWGPAVARQSVDDAARELWLPHSGWGPVVVPESLDGPAARLPQRSRLCKSLVEKKNQRINYYRPRIDILALPGEAINNIIGGERRLLSKAKMVSTEFNREYINTLTLDHTLCLGESSAIVLSFV